MNIPPDFFHVCMLMYSCYECKNPTLVFCNLFKIMYATWGRHLAKYSYLHLGYHLYFTLQCLVWGPAPPQNELPANASPGRHRVNLQVLRFLFSTWDTHLELLVTGSGVVQPWILQVFGEWTNKWRIWSLSFPLLLHTCVCVCVPSASQVKF